MPKLGTAIRTLLITKKDGEEIQIDIPEEWKVTFGPAVAGLSPKTDGRIPLVLRVYESDKMQRAIFADVVSFRDTSIPMRVKKVDVKEKSGFMECDGVRKHTTFEARTTNWVNPDEVAEDPEPRPLLKMPSDTEMLGQESES